MIWVIDLHRLSRAGQCPLQAGGNPGPCVASAVVSFSGWLVSWRGDVQRVQTTSFVEAPRSGCICCSPAVGLQVGSPAGARGGSGGCYSMPCRQAHPSPAPQPVVLTSPPWAGCLHSSPLHTSWAFLLSLKASCGKVL